MQVLACWLRIRGVLDGGGRAGSAAFSRLCASLHTAAQDAPEGRAGAAGSGGWHTRV